jgi:hypothetical protein
MIFSAKPAPKQNRVIGVTQSSDRDRPGCMMLLPFFSAPEGLAWSLAIFA